MATFRVTTRLVCVETYEIECDTKEEAEKYFVEGTLIRTDEEYVDVEEVKEIEACREDR